MTARHLSTALLATALPATVWLATVWLALAWALISTLAACQDKSKPAGASAGTGELSQTTTSAAGQAGPSSPVSYPGHHLSPLAEPPDWSQLDQFQNTMTRDELVSLLHRVYTHKRQYKSFITIHSDRAVIRMSRVDPDRVYELRFARPDGGSPRMPRPRRARDPDALALDGLTVAIDPGHIGGPWAKTEWRWYRLDRGQAVAEGDLNLIVAKILSRQLERHGARAILVRDSARPVAAIDPTRLEGVAYRALLARGHIHNDLSDNQQRLLIRHESAKLAYRTAEIRARARRINRDIAPDLTICIHFDAEVWDDPARPTLTGKNHVHLIVNGSYMAEELEYEDIRFGMLYKLLSRDHAKEMAVSVAVAKMLAEATGLPPEIYPESSPARRMTEDGYIWARNLLANRLYRGPVLYLEPYVLNSRVAWARIQAGDYPGLRYVAGARRPSIFREYAGAVTRGLIAWRKSRRQDAAAD